MLPNYVYPYKNGYIIKYGGVIYGSYSTLSDALRDRDILVWCNWDWDCFINTPVDFCVGSCDGDFYFLRYIDVCGGVMPRFRVRKFVGGRVVCFGVFSCLRFCVWWRDYCVLCGWDLGCMI